MGVKEIIGFCLAVIIPLLAYFKKSLKLSATIEAFVMIIIATFASWYLSYLLIFSFILISVIEKILKKKTDNIENQIAKKSGGPRDFIQVFVNGGVATLSAILYIITKNDIFIYIYVISIAESLADSAASSFGIAFGKKVYDICSFKRIENGTSGGISVPGTISAFVLSLILGLITFLFGFCNLTGLIMITLCPFIGCIFDSILGSKLQLKNKCVVCGKITEKNIHCEKEVKYYKGIKWMNNDVVNGLSNLFASLLTLVILLF